LVSAILNEDENAINQLIDNEKLDRDPYFDRGYIVFEMTNIEGDLENADSVFTYYQQDKQNAWERVYDDFRDRVDDWSEELTPIFEKYYEENREELKTRLGVFNLESFKRNFLDNFASDNSIREEYLDESSRLSSGNYEGACQDMINEIEKYIKFDQRYRTYDVSVNISQLVQYLISKNIEKVDNLNEMLDDYIYHYDVMTEYEYLYDYDMDYASYEKIKDKVDNYFETLMENGEATQQCVEYRKNLHDILEKLFNGRNSIDNEHVYFSLQSTEINCADGSVNVDFHNKDTGKTYKGSVKIENIPSYVTNYQLFESLVTFKKNII
jgi:hypothetical protein